MKKDLIQTMKIIVIALVLIMGVNYVFAWTGPTQTPPNENTPTPINVGVTDQIKNGGLGLNVLSVFGSAYIQDKLGINDSTPDLGLILDVEGKTGAVEYCDENGLNCITPSDIVALIGNCSETPPPLSDCTLDGQTVTSGNSGTFYQTQTVSVGNTCASEQRLCTDGTFTTGSYQYSNCTVALPTVYADCTLDGITRAHGESYNFYSTTSSTSCSSYDLIRTCNDGTFDGSATYQYASCTAPVIPAPTCSITASPNPMVAGTSGTLTWSSTDATSFTINGGSVTTPSGSVSGTLSATTIYSGVVIGPGGTGTCSETVTVTAPPSIPSTLRNDCSVRIDVSSIWGTGPVYSCNTTSGGMCSAGTTAPLLWMYYVYFNTSCDIIKVELDIGTNPTRTVTSFSPEIYTLNWSLVPISYTGAPGSIWPQLKALLGTGDHMISNTTVY